MRSYFWCLYYSINLLFFKHVSCCKFPLYALQWQRISFVFCWCLELLRYISCFEMNYALTLMHRCPLTYSLANFEQLVHKPCRERKLMTKIRNSEPSYQKGFRVKIVFQGENIFYERSSCIHRRWMAITQLTHSRLSFQPNFVQRILGWRWF